MFGGYASLDNAGPRSTGNERLNGNLTLASPFGFGDQLATDLLLSNGSDYIRASYTIPMGSDGWRFGVNSSHLSYKLVASDFSTLHGNGSSDSAGLEASYPIIRSRLKNLYLNLNYDAKKFDNEFDGTTTSRYKTNALSMALNGNLFDDWGGGGANTASLAWGSGNVDLRGSPNQAADAQAGRTDGAYSKLRWTLARQQVLTADLSLFGQFSGQVASKNLDSSERFYLGGANGVRAYPVNEGGGSEGEMVNLEMRWKLPQNVTLTGFYDWGRVMVNRNNHFSGSASPNAYSLKGHGLSIGWAAPFGAYFRTTWAHRDGNNPNAAANGNDQDGTLIKNRVWLTASLPF